MTLPFSAVVLFVTLLALMFLGMPIAMALILSSILSIIVDGSYPITVAAQRMFTGADTFSLLAIPFFMLAGEIMQKGGLSKRLVDFANSLVGWISGGLSLVSIVACTFFAAISGSSVATSAAIGGIMYPEMVKHGYPKDYSAAVQAIGGTLGIVIPPSIVFIMYGTATNVSIADLLMSGVIPGFFTCFALCALAVLFAKKHNYPKNNGFDIKEVGKTFKASIFALLMPLIILGGIYAGIFTPTESAVIAVVYGFVVSLFIYKEIELKDIGTIIIATAKSTANLMILVIAAQLFGWLITMYNVPNIVTNAVLSVAGNKYIFLIFVNIILLITGMFMEVGATVLILAPIMHPMAVAYGINPVHFGMIVVFLLALGQATPPFGTTLFVSCGISKEPVVNVSKKVMPFIICEVVCALVFSFVPIMSTWLPGLMK